MPPEDRLREALEPRARRSVRGDPECLAGGVLRAATAAARGEGGAAVGDGDVVVLLAPVEERGVRAQVVVEVGEARLARNASGDAAELVQHHLLGVAVVAVLVAPAAAVLTVFFLHVTSRPIGSSVLSAFGG